MAIHENCHLIAVTGGKGGVGKSVFATNLACAFLLEMRSPVLLVDLDQQSCGDLNILTGLRPQQTVGELANYSGSITTESVPQILSRHNSGLIYLGAVRALGEQLVGDPELVSARLESLSRIFRFIIVDVGSLLAPLQMAIVQQSCTTLLVTLPEILAVNQCHRQLLDFLSATLPLEMFQIVINEANRTSLSAQAIAQNLKCPVLGVIPQDEITVAASIQGASPFVLYQPNLSLSASYHDIVRKLSGGILQQARISQRPSSVKNWPTPGALVSVNNNSGGRPIGGRGPGGAGGSKGSRSARTMLKEATHHDLIEAMDLKKGVADTQGDPNKEAILRKKTQQVISQMVDKNAPQLSREERSQVIKEVLDEALGLGPLEDLLDDASVSEIMVNGCDKIFIEREGRLTLSPVTFTSNIHLRNVIQRIVLPLGRQINENVPYVDARLKDGSRVNAIIEPLAIDGPALTIRKFAKDPITADHFLKWRTLTDNMVEFLRICVENGKNIIISGGTGTGKTTLLNVLSGFIPRDERIVTVEDAAELQLKQDHVVRLETRPANMEGAGAVSIRDLVRNALRMRPDRIIVGECRDGAALDMLSAMNTGHDGSMTTVHANSPREAIARLETLCLMAGMELPAIAIRQQIASAVHVLLQISRLSDGSRKVINISEVVGMQGEVVTLQDIYAYKEKVSAGGKDIGLFHAAGFQPTFFEKLKMKGVNIPKDLFAMDEGPQASAGESSQSSVTPLKRVMPSNPNVSEVLKNLKKR